MPTQTPTYPLKGYSQSLTTTEHPTSTVLVEANFNGIHKSTSAILEVLLTLPKITYSMVGKVSIFKRGGVGSIAVKPASGDTIADGTTSSIVARNAMSHEVDVASITLRAISLTKWAIDSMVGSWPTEAL